MKHLYIRHQHVITDPLQQERLQRALTIILEHQEAANARSALCPRLHASAATGKHHRQLSAHTQTLHSAAGVDPAA